MVLVDADAVKAELRGVFELVQVLVVNLMTLDRVEQCAVNVYPDAAMLLGEIVR